MEIIFSNRTEGLPIRVNWNYFNQNFSHLNFFNLNLEFFRLKRINNTVNMRGNSLLQAKFKV